MDTRKAPTMTAGAFLEGRGHAWPCTSSPGDHPQSRRRRTGHAISAIRTDESSGVRESDKGRICHVGGEGQKRAGRIAVRRPFDHIGQATVRGKTKLEPTRRYGR